MPQAMADNWRQFCSKTETIGGAAARFGQPLFLFACVGFGLVEIAFGDLPQVHNWGINSTAVANISGISLALFASLSLVPRWVRAGGIALAFHWAIAMLFAAVGAMMDAASTLSWVPMSKAAVFGLAALTIAGGTRPRSHDFGPLILRWTFGTALLLYGSIHLLHRSLIAQLIPAWIPAHSMWPWITGPILVLAGLSLLVGKWSNLASLAIAAMFAAWIPLVHVQRIAESPRDSFEWAFVLSALALAGVALMVASQSRSGWSTMSCARE